MDEKPTVNLSLGLYGNCVLTVIALLLAAIALRPLAAPPVVAAQSDTLPKFHYFYIEPGTTTLRKPDGTRQVDGKMVIDLRDGGVWGFPTVPGVPYPIDVAHSEPPVSTPMYLGKFEMSKVVPGSH